MREIKLPFGTIYVEDIENRAEKDEIKIFDSNKKHLDTWYLNSQNIEQSIVKFNNYLNRSKYQLSIKRFLKGFMAYQIVSRDWRKVAQSLEHTFSHYKEKINSSEEVMNHAWTNKIGEYYIQVI